MSRKRATKVSVKRSVKNKVKQVKDPANNKQLPARWEGRPWFWTGSAGGGGLVEVPGFAGITAGRPKPFAGIFIFGSAVKMNDSFLLLSCSSPLSTTSKHHLQHHLVCSVFHVMARARKKALVKKKTCLEPLFILPPTPHSERHGLLTEDDVAGFSSHRLTIADAERMQLTNVTCSFCRLTPFLFLEREGTSHTV